MTGLAKQHYYKQHYYKQHYYKQHYYKQHYYKQHYYKQPYYTYRVLHGHNDNAIGADGDEGLFCSVFGDAGALCLLGRASPCTLSKST